jgi:hypothetical protein
MMLGASGMGGESEQGGGSGAGGKSGTTEQKPNVEGGSIPIGVPVSPEEFRRQKEEAAKPKPAPSRERPQEDK